MEALYPFIDIKLAGQIIRDRIINSELKFDGIDWRWVLVYLKLTMSPLDKVENKVTGILPRELKKQGAPPSMLIVEVDQTKERWWYPVSPDSLNQDQKKQLLGLVMEQFV